MPGLETGPRLLVTGREAGLQVYTESTLLDGWTPNKDTLSASVTQAQGQMSTSRPVQARADILGTVFSQALCSSCKRQLKKRQPSSIQA